MSTTTGSSSDLLALCRDVLLLSPLPAAVLEGPFYALRYANPAFCQLAGQSEVHLLGQPVAACLPECPGCIALLKRVNDSGKPAQHTEEGYSKAWSYAAWPMSSIDLPQAIMLQITETSELHHRATLMNEALLVSAVQQHEIVETVTASAEKLSSTIVEKDEELDRNKEDLRSLASQLLQAQEDERRRLARELHDSFAQQLASIGMQVFQLEREIPNETGHTLAARVQAQLGELAAEVRVLSHQLHPPALEHLGLIASLRGLLEDFERTHSVPTRLLASELSSPLPIATATALFRVAQESLWNVAKHAGKEALVTLYLTQESDCLILSIEDTGTGFDPEEVRGKGGLGLISIQERARLVGGSAKVEASPGEGTRVSVRIPRPA